MQANRKPSPLRHFAYSKARANLRIRRGRAASLESLGPSWPSCSCAPIEYLLRGPEWLLLASESRVMVTSPSPDRRLAYASPLRIRSKGIGGLMDQVAAAILKFGYRVYWKNNRTFARCREPGSGTKTRRVPLTNIGFGVRTPQIRPRLRACTTASSRLCVRSF